MMEYMDSGFKNSNPWQKGYWNEQMFRWRRHTQMDDERQDHSDPKKTFLKDPPQIIVDP